MNNICAKWSILFLSLFSFLVNSAEFTGDDKLALINLLKVKIATEYVLTEKINGIEQALSTLQQSPEFKQAITEQHIAKLLSQTIREFDGHFNFQWRNPNVGVTDKNNQHPAHEGWFNMLNRKTLVLIKSKYLMAILVISVFLDSIM